MIEAIKSTVIGVFVFSSIFFLFLLPGILEDHFPRIFAVLCLFVTSLFFFFIGMCVQSK